MRDLVVCRTAALGGHVWRCDECGHERVAYNACRNRHCPKCQASARAKWLDERAQELLPVEYFHVVFTIPPAIAEVARQNKKVMYGILMRASGETLKQIAADPKHLGAKIGFLSVLHTWAQNLLHHPHVHCVVPGGGLSIDGERWISCRPGFFLPVRVLSKVFRGKLLDMTRQAFVHGELEFQGGLARLEDQEEFASHLKTAYANDWVVYAKPPFGGPQQVYKYLARYTHRVAISNHRLVSLQDGRVRFHWKDRARRSRQRLMTLDAVEFIRRFLLHVLPKGFVRIRHYGLLANRTRRDMLARCRELMAVESAESPVCTIEPYDDQVPCPECETGHMVRIGVLPETARHQQPPIRLVQILDSS